MKNLFKVLIIPIVLLTACTDKKETSNATPAEKEKIQKMEKSTNEMDKQAKDIEKTSKDLDNALKDLN